MSVSYIKKKEKEKRAKQEKKKSIINIVFIVIILGLIGALAVMMFSGDNKMNVEEKIKELTYQEYADKIKEDKYTVVILTRPGCGHCSNYKPFVNYVANEYNLDIYELNISASNVTQEQFLEIHSYSALKDQYLEGEAIIPTPATIIVKNGVEVSSIVGNIGYDGLVEFLDKNNVITKK